MLTAFNMEFDAINKLNASQSTHTSILISIWLEIVLPLF